MKMEGKNELVVLNKFEEMEVGIITDENGNLFFELYSTGFALGYQKEAKGKKYAQKDRIDKIVVNAGISTVVRGVQQYLNEEMLYDFMLEARTNKCKAFRKWVTSEVLPSINHNGGYIVNSASEEQVDKLTKYSLPKLKNTFKTENIEQIHNIYEDVKNFYKHNYRDTDFRLKMMKNIERGLNDRIENYAQNKQVAFITICDDLIKTIKEDKEELRLRISGGQKAYKTRTINIQGKLLDEKNEMLSDLESKIANLNPSLSNYMVLTTHGISENYLYETVLDNYTGKNITVKTNTYKNWIRNFPSQQLKKKEELDVDWNKPIIVFLKFDCMDRFDKQNLLKATIDQIITREYGENDNIIDKIIVEKNMDVDNYKDGRIYCYIKNVD